MSLVDTVNARCREVGLEDSTLPFATVRTPEQASATMVSGGNARTTLRELPRISIDVRGTLSGGEGQALTPGDTIRDIEVLETLGEGGMGRVFLARQHSLDREVAIKTLRDRASDRERRALIAEGAVTGFLEHPAIIPVHALGLDDHSRPVLVMKRVVGVTWSASIAEKPDDLDEHLAVLVQVSNAVDFAHSKGVLHRDLKPQNVLVGAFGEVQLVDFGIALRIEDANDQIPMAGTPAYMAPEMVVGEKLDVRTDVYLLGATLHHVLTGQARHRGKNVHETLLAAAQSNPFEYPKSVPAGLAALANAATARDPADRPKTAAMFRKGLVDYLRHKSSVALATSAMERVASLRASEVASLADEEAQHRLDVLGAEARLALTHALTEWPDNAAALELLAELDALLAARRARAADLERLAHELDPRVAHPQRVALAGAFAAVGVTLGIWAILRGSAHVTTKDLFHRSLVPLALVLLLVAAMRRQLASNALNRRAAAGLVVLVATISLGRAVALVAGLPPSAAILQDLLVVIAGSAMAAVHLARVFGWITALALAAAVVVARVPEHAVTAFSLVSGAALLLMTLGVIRSVSRTA